MPGKGDRDNVPQSVIAPNDNPIACILSIRRYRNMTREEQDNEWTKWHATNTAGKNAVRANIKALQEKQRKLRSGEAKWTDPNFAAPFTAADLPYIPPLTRSQIETSSKRKDSSVAVAQDFNAEVAQKRARILTDTTNSPAGPIRRTGPAASDANAAHPFDEDDEDDEDPVEQANVGLAHLQLVRDAAADDKEEEAKSGKRRSNDEPCTRVGHQVDRRANRAVDTAHLAAAEAADALFFPDCPNGIPRRYFFGCELCDVEDPRAHGGRSTLAQLQRDETLLVISGLAEDDRETVFMLLKKLLKALKHKEPRGSERIMLGRIPGVFGRCSDAVKSLIERRKQKRKQRSQTHRTADEIIAEDIADIRATNPSATSS